MPRCRVSPTASRRTRLVLESVEDRCVPAAAGPADFPAAITTVESFEGLTDTANSPQSPGLGFFSPGFVSAYTFASGVTLTKPIPNPGEGANGVEVGDFAAGDANFALGTNGAITAAAHVPNGTAYLGLDASSASGPVGFTFAHDVGAVGAYVTATDGANVTIEAFDAAGNSLGTVTQASVNRTSWTAADPTAFIGIKAVGGIRRIEINGDFVVMDLLQSRPVVPALAAAANPPTAVAGSGTALNDTAVLSGGASPTGTITFTLLGPGGAPTGYSTVVTVAGNGTYTTAMGTNPGGFVPTQAGTYQWQAAYSGDAGNTAVTADATAQAVAVSPAPPPPAPLPALVGVAPFAAGPDVGGGGVVNQYDAAGTLQFTTDAFPGTTGGVRTAVADFTGDGTPDLAVVTGPGAPGRVRVFDGVTRGVVFDAPAFEGFPGGLFVTAGDVTGDGAADLILTPDLGGGPRVVVVRGRDFQPVASFFGITDPDFRGGARAGSGDMNGDGRADVVVAAGFEGGPRVAAFDGVSVAAGDPAKLFGDLFVFDPVLRNGVYVAAGDVNGDGFADLIAGAGPGGGPRVLTLSGKDLIAGLANSSQVLTNFFGGNPDNRGGIRVAVKNLDGDFHADLVVGDGEGDGSQVTTYLGKNFAGADAPAALAFPAFPGFLGGVFVG